MADDVQPRLLLKEWRTYRGLTQEALADAMEIPQGHYSMIERGKRPWHARHLWLASQALDCRPSDLLTTDPSKPAQIDTVWRDIPEEMREQALRVLEAFKTGQQPER